MSTAKSIVFDAVSVPLYTAYPDIYIASRSMNIPASFPAVSIVEKDNHDHIASQDSASLENNTELMFEVQGYSNLEVGGEDEVDAIFEIISTVFHSIGFIRISLMPVDNLPDPSIYRVVGRYTGVMNKAKTTVYRR